MEISIKNFETTLPKILEDINTSDVLSIDCEFTGLNSGVTKYNALDTPHERYCKQLKNLDKFMLMQFGLTTFTYNESSGAYDVCPYYFYVFPFSEMKGVKDTCFTCQCSSLRYMSDHSFDFNKWIREGIPFLNMNEEKRFLKIFEDLLEKNEQEHSNALTPENLSSSRRDFDALSPDSKDFLQGISKIVDIFMADSDKLSINIENLNGFQRRLVYQMIKTSYPVGIYAETVTDKQTHKASIKLLKVSEDEFLKKISDNHNKNLKDLNDVVGFSHVIRAISNSCKMIIGHNMLLDLMFTISHFFCDLPTDYEEFKALSLTIFPKVIDTKVMASIHPFKDNLQHTGLKQLYTSINEKPFKKISVSIPSDFKNYNDSKDYHNAGFDSFATGVCFLTFKDYLGSICKPSISHLTVESPLLQPFFNKIFLYKVVDMMYFDLKDDDLIPPRDNIFHLEFPQNWQTKDIVDLFSKFGPVYVHWINDVSAYVQILRMKHSYDEIIALVSGHLNDSIVRIKHYTSSSPKSTNASNSVQKRPQLEKSHEPPPAKKSKTKSDASLTRDDEEFKPFKECSDW